MKLKKIEGQVRRYAPLTLSFKREYMSTDRINISELLDEEGNIIPNTTLLQINNSIISENPSADPKWLAEGRVVDPNLNLSNLVHQKHINPNRTDMSLRYQLEILMKQLSEAITYEDIDNWYDKVNLLLKRSLKRRETASLLTILRLELAKEEKLVSSQQEYIESLLKLLERSFIGK
ncbi:hypothetical protein N9X46_02415 [Paracoccaceae bacterium]|nr:hypothetical protein [Paracoccaceae bacterium]